MPEQNLEKPGPAMPEQGNYSVVPTAEIDGRLDAGHYTRESLNYVRFISTLPRTGKLKEIAKVVSGPFGSTLHSSAYRRSGIPFIRASNIKNLFIGGDIVYISKADHLRLTSSRLEAKDIVLYKIGAGLGTIGLVTNEFEEVSISENMIGIKPLDKSISAFLAIFFLTRYGQLQVQRQKSMQAQPKINVADIEEIVVPYPTKDFQSRITLLLQQAHNKRREADKKYGQAMELLYNALGIREPEFEPEQVCVVSSKSINKDGPQRLDTEYHNPRYLLFIDKLLQAEEKTEFEVAPLSKVGKLTKGIEVGSKAYIKGRDAYPFLRVANLSEKGIQRTDSDVCVRQNLYLQLRNEFKPEPHDVLVSKDGTLGLSVVVQENFHEFIYSGGIVRISLLKVNPYYLSLVLNSQVFRSQAEREAIGSVIKHLSLEKLKSLKIPLVLNRSEIGTLVKESLELDEQSRQLIQQAKSKAEEYMEKEAGRHNKGA